jgi:hypothetical protein
MSVSGSGSGRYRLAQLEVAPGSALSVLDLPAGACLSDGTHRAEVSRAGMSVDVSRWRIDQIELAWPLAGEPPAGLQVLVLQPGRRQAERRLCALLPQGQAPALWLSGLPAESRISDGVHTVFSTGVAQRYDIYGWDLTRLTLRPPRGWHAALRLRVQPVGGGEPALGVLQIRLLSANAYLSGQEDEQAQHSLPVMNIVVEGLMPETQHAVRLHGRPALGREAEETPLDDDALAELEKKFRLN